MMSRKNALRLGRRTLLVIMIAPLMLIPIGLGMRFVGSALIRSVGLFIVDAGMVSLTAALGGRVLTLHPQERNRRTLEILAFTCVLALSVAFVLRHVGVLTVSATVYVVAIAVLAVTATCSMFWSEYRNRS
jgi:hypothetical protein